MTFFHDLNKRLADLATKQDATRISEDAKAVAPTSKLAQALNERDMGKHNNATTGFAALAKKAGKEYGSKAAGERVAGAQFQKMKKAGQLEEGHCPSCDCSPCECVEESALQGYLGKKKYGPEGMKALQKAGREHAGKAKMDKIRNRYDKMDEADLDEVSRGEYIKQQDATAEKSGKQKFNAFGQTFNTDEIDEGFKEMDAWMAQREKEKGTGKFDKKERTLPGGMKATTYTRRHDDEEDKDDEAKSDAPKKKGRPKGPAKGPERVTAKSYKYKAGRPTKTKEGLDSDGVMMTRPSNMSSESVSPAEQGEYNDEAGMTKDSLHTIVRHARELEKCLRDNENLPEWVQEKVGQIKGMMSSVTDYILSTHERDAEQHPGREGITIEPMAEGIDKAQVQAVYNELANLRKFAKQVQGGGQFPQGFASQLETTLWSAMKLIQAQQPNNAQVFEKAVSQAQRKAAGIAHAAQKGEIPKSRLRGASKEMAKMPQGELHKFAATKEKGLPNKISAKKEGLEKYSTSALKAASGKDFNADKKSGVPAQYSTAQLKAELEKRTKGKVEEGGKPDFVDLDKDGNKTEPMKQAAKQVKGKKEEKVDETTVAGSVATATASGKPGKGGMTFGKGVYEGYNQQFTQALNESISIESKMQECGDGEMAPAITITADGEEAAKLMMLLKLAGLESQIPKACPTCGGSPCGCDQMVDENSPDWPTNTEKLAAEPNLRTYSGGLNGPKSTGQTTVPVVASQLRRQASMEESVELERSLFKTWKNYKG